MEEIDIDDTEEITLFTDDEQVVLDQLDFEFEQINKIRGVYRKLTVFNGHQCYQAIKNKHQRKIKYRVDLAYLNPIPVRQRKTDWKWLYISIIFLIFSCLLVYIISMLNRPEPSAYLLLGVVISVVGFLIGLLLFLHKSYDRVIFRSHFGNVHLIQLLNNYPSKEDFMNFLGSFIGKIKAARKIRNFSPAKYLARELQELRRLKDEQVITVKQYEKAKKIIFKHESFNASKIDKS